MKKALVTMLTLIFVFGITFFVPKASANSAPVDPVIGTSTTSIETPTTENSETSPTDTGYHQYYQDGITKGAIDPNTLSYDDFYDDIVNRFIPIYQNGLTLGAYDITFTFDDWLKANNYGQAPVGSMTITPKSIVGGFTLKAGDIFITNSTEDGSSGFYLGHAGIANGDGHILDMPGGKNSSDNNRQSTMSDWINQYSVPGKWIKVYRLRDSNLASQVAKYADTHYYSSNGSATKNIHIDYGLNPHLYETSPSYCSKLVYDAYYFGSGSIDVMIPSPSVYVLPFGLIDTFEPSYKPSLVKTYQN